MGGLGRQQLGLEAGAVVDGGPGHPFAQLEVALVPRRLGAGHEQLGGAPSSHQAQGGQVQGVLLAASARRLGQRPGQGTFAARADAEAHDVAEDRVGEDDLETPAVLAAGDRPLVLERRHRGRIGQLVEGRLGQWFGQRDELEHVAFPFADRAQPHGDQLDQARRRLQRPAQSPDPTVVDQEPSFEGAVDQLAEEKGVAQRALDDQARSRGIDGSTEDGQQQLLDRRCAERPELNAPGRVVLPQHDHGIGSRPESPP